METLLEADCCLTCGSTDVYFQPNECQFMCNTCGHAHTGTGVLYMPHSRNRGVLRALLLLCVCLCCLSLTSEARAFKTDTIPINGILAPGYYLVPSDTVIINDTITVVRFDTVTILRRDTTLVLRRDTVTLLKHDTTTITVLQQDTTLTALKQYFPSLTKPTLFSVGKDTTFSGITVKPLMPDIIHGGTNTPLTMDLNKGEIVLTPDISLFNAEALKQKAAQLKNKKK